MELPVSIFLSFIAVSLVLTLIGLWKKIPVLMFLCGFLFFFWAIMTDTIIMGYSTNEIGDTALFSYDVKSFTGAADICGGISCFNVRGEYLLSTSSMIFGDTIDCIDIPLRKIGAPTGTATIGIYDHAQSVDNPIIQSFGTIDVSTLDVNIWIYHTFCLPLGDTYTIGDQDVIGVRYDGGDMSNAVRVAVTTGDVFDTSNTEHTRQDASTNLWTNFATVDTTMTTYLRADNGIITTEQTFPFDAYPKLLFILVGSLIMIIGAIVWKMPDEKKN